MEGKYSLKHLYNNGKSSQMKPLEFIDLMNWLDQNADGMIGDAVEVTEKIDGSSNFIGYDGRIYVEKFGFDKKFYDESDFDNPFSGAKARALLDFAHSIPELPDYLEDLCNDNNCASVKIQIEVLMTKFSKAPDVCQVVLVPYELNKLGKDGSGFIIQVLNGDTLKPVVDEKIAVDTLCDIMSSDNFHVTGTNPKQFTPIDIKEDIQEVKNIIADYTESMGKSVEEILTSRKRSEAEMKKALKAEIENIQEALQDKLSEAFPVGDYGEYYEGLVFKLTNGMMFKVTSKKFKQFMAEHNHWNESLENKYGRLTEETLSPDYIKNCEEAIRIMSSYIKEDVSVNFYIVKPTSSSTIHIKTNNESINSNGWDPTKVFKGEVFEEGNTSKNFIINFEKSSPFIENKHQHFFISIDGIQYKLDLESTSGSCQALEVVNYTSNKLGSFEKRSSTGSVGTSIQEAIYGILLDIIIKDDKLTEDKVKAGKSLDQSYISTELKALYNDTELSPQSNIKEKLGIDTKNTQDYHIRNMSAEELKNNFPESWINSVSNLFLDSNINTIKDGLNITDPQNYILLHKNITPVFKASDSNIESLWKNLTKNLMDAHYKSKRDIVNPSDIYFINKSKSDEIKKFNDSIKTKMLETDYTSLHNKAQDAELFKGVSLKMPGKNIHTEFISIKSENATFIKIDCEDPRNSTINLVDYPLEYSWAVTGGSPHQGQLNIEVPFMTKEGKQARAKLQIKSNGNPTATLEATLVGGKAQLGKGKTLIELLLESSHSLQNKINGLNDSVLQDTILQIFTESNKSSFAKGSFDNIKLYIDNSTKVNTIKLPTGKDYKYYVNNLDNISNSISNEEEDNNILWYNMDLDKKNHTPDTQLFNVDKDIRRHAILITKYLLGLKQYEFNGQPYLNKLGNELKIKDANTILNIIFKCSAIFSICSKYPIKFIGKGNEEFNRLLDESKFNDKIVNYYKIS